MLQALRAKVLAEKARRSGSRTFAAFVKQAWPFVSHQPLIWSWYIDAICLHLEAVARGEIKRLVINMPPGHAKSTLVTILFPAWLWTQRPSTQILSASYSADLAVEHSVKCRNLVRSDWYRANFSGPGGWRLRDDQNVKDYYANTVLGHRVAVGVGGSGTGRRADGIILDDLLNAKEAASKAARAEAATFIGQVATERFNRAADGWMVLVMQRLHEEDPTGFVMAGDRWQLLRLPTEYETDGRCITYHVVNGVRREFWRDPRTEPGELLAPELLPREEVEAKKQPDALGVQGFSAQHQQRPAPAEGNMFKRADWRFWKPDGVSATERAPRPKGCYEGPARALPPKFDQVIMSVDANFKDKVDADRVSIQLIAEKGADRFLLHRVNAPLGFTKTVKAIRQVRADFKHLRIRKVLIEAKANGDAIIETLKEDIPGVIGVEPEGGKEPRAWSIQPQVEGGNCYLPDGAPWLADFIEEFAVFPNGKHDDDVDAFSQGLIDLSFGEETTMQKWARASG